ncbi:Uncharacterized conserved protein YndB, AHSA1/START domain [Microbacterium azadirachtae]|uniref:Uncharacterized conserved protein YndB, AHSA1/START domain n=1 Tax=Microbacterium azadirachtae TaxID=582680 RepID=A0A1I6FZS1_9MICO|nr:SRPBCC domain-containing protein [Microbacterium azadirachtae]SFR35453.1 Uncharacterized conserved protein YndB, AHSA1/START domain [Microbacterium azadirachtae]
MTSTTGRNASVVDEGAFRVTRSIDIAAPVPKVWRAVTDPELLSRWFGRTVLLGDGAGAHGTMSFEGYGAIPIRVEAIDPERSVTYRWNNDDALGVLPAQVEDASSTVFTFTLVAQGEGTQLTVVESGFERTSDPIANLESHRRGWDLELDKLVALIEGEL